MASSIQKFNRLTNIRLLISLILICSCINAHENQEIIFDFDGEDQQTKATTTPTTHTQQVVPTGLPAKLIQKVTGWNDTLVAKILGQISPRPPHPFVIPLNDENYQEVIESEIDSIRPGWGSDQDTIWVISVVATDRPSTLFDEEFDKLASNSSLATMPIPPKTREDGPNVAQKDPSDQYVFKPQIRFARIDYMANTDFILTKWLIFKCPLLVVVTKRGKEIRFFKTGASPPPAEHLGDFLREERYLHKPVWNSTFSEGNSGEWVVIWMGRAFQGFHMLTDKVPGWLLLIVTSMLGSSLMQWLHKSTPSSTRPSTNPKASQLASPQLKKDLADAAVQLAQITNQKHNSSLKPQSSTAQRRK